MSASYRGREELGARLRQLRVAGGFDGKDFAARLGWSQSKVSRIETGKQNAGAEDLRAWVHALGTDDALLDDLLNQLRTVRLEYETWSRRLRAGLASRQRMSASLEAETRELRAFEPDIVPGLLQTAEYARHVLQSVAAFRGGTAVDVVESVRARLKRQEALYDPDKRFWFLLTEAALRFHVCPLGVLRAQLDRLLAVSSLENVELRVVPFETQLPFSPSHGFWLFDDALVQVDTFSAELSLRDADDVELYRRIFDLLWEVGEPAGKSVVRAMG